jgi:hypothetical protein
VRPKALKSLTKSADGSQPHDGRWREHRDKGLLDAAVLLIERSSDGGSGQFFGFALLEGLQGHKHDAGVGTIGEAVDAQAGEGDRVIDARLLQGDLVHTTYHRLGAVESRRVGKLRETHQILLVLRWNEAGRRACEADVSERYQSAIYKERDAPGAYDAAHAADVAR